MRTGFQDVDAIYICLVAELDASKLHVHSAAKFLFVG